MSEKTEGSEEKILESWKEIAAYLKRDVRTVIRWEKSEGLPVHRHLHQARSSVYAYPSEIAAWSASRKPRREEVPAWRRVAPSLAFAAVLMLSLLLVADAPFSATAAAQQQPGMTSRRVLTVPPAGTIFGGTRASRAVSPDGRFLTYTDWTPGNGGGEGDLAVHEFSTGRVRVISDSTHPADYADLAAISRDSRQVVYGWYKGDTETYELQMASLEGTGVPQSRVLFANEDVSWVAPFDWSPDGNWIAVQLTRKGNAGQMGLISVRDGSLRVLKSADWLGANELFFSPDGKYLGFDLPVGETANDPRDVFILAVDGSRQVAAAIGSSNDTMMGWSPDGKYLLFASDRGGPVGLWAIAVTDGRPQGVPQLIKPDIPRGSFGVTASGSLYMGVAVNNRDIHVATMDFETGKRVSGIVKPV